MKKVLISLFITIIGAWTMLSLIYGTPIVKWAVSYSIQSDSTGIEYFKIGEDIQVWLIVEKKSRFNKYVAYENNIKVAETYCTTHSTKFGMLAYMQIVYTREKKNQKPQKIFLKQGS